MVVNLYRTVIYLLTKFMYEYLQSKESSTSQIIHHQQQLDQHYIHQSKTILIFFVGTIIIVLVCCWPTPNVLIFVLLASIPSSTRIGVDYKLPISAALTSITNKLSLLSLSSDFIGKAVFSVIVVNNNHFHSYHHHYYRRIVIYKIDSIFATAVVCWSLWWDITG